MISFAKTHSNAKLPVRATAGSAGLDVFAVEDQWILPGSTIVVKTGLKLADCPNHIYLRIAPRSSLGVKGIHVLAGVVDNDYRGEIGVVLYMGPESNQEMFPRNGVPEGFVCRDIKKHHISAGSKICQLIPERYEPGIQVQWSEEIAHSQRGEGGFGSTGV